jgi:hypothetical protein
MDPGAAPLDGLGRPLSRGPATVRALKAPAPSFATPRASSLDPLIWAPGITGA